MTLAALRAALDPPAEPRETGGSEQWPHIEETLGTILPDDYKEFINTHGTGAIGHFLSAYNPFSANRFLNLLTQVPNVVKPFRDIKEEFGEGTCPYPLYPERNGLLPWGVTDNGDTLFWLMVGEPASWPVIVNQITGGYR